jgi:hypothetical protein
MLECGVLGWEVDLDTQTVKVVPIKSSVTSLDMEGLYCLYIGVFFYNLDYYILYILLSADQSDVISHLTQHVAMMERKKLVTPSANYGVASSTSTQAKHDECYDVSAADDMEI